MTTTGAKARVRVKEVDVLRGLAALTVVLSHYFPHWKRYLGDVWVIVPGELGYYAVKLFFVISGLVIFMTLDRCNSVREFGVLRFSRLYPAYWTTLVLATLVGTVFAGRSLWAGGFVVNTTMFQEFIGYPNLDNVYWSLTVELAFYLNVAWLYALGVHKNVLSCTSVWLALSALWAVTVFDPNSDDRDWFALLFALDYAPYFVIGILFYRAHDKGWRAPEFSILAAALVVEFMIASWEGLFVAIVSTSLVYAALAGHLKFINGRVTLWLGAISYSLYLGHRNIGYDLLPWLHDHGLGPVPAIAVTTLIVIGLASAVTFWVERPSSRFIRSRMIKRQRPAPT